jgi:hypothetical protein
MVSMSCKNKVIIQRELYCTPYLNWVPSIAGLPGNCKRWKVLTAVFRGGSMQ